RSTPKRPCRTSSTSTRTSRITRSASTRGSSRRTSSGGCGNGPASSPGSGETRRGRERGRPAKPADGPPVAPARRGPPPVRLLPAGGHGALGRVPRGARQLRLLAAALSVPPDRPVHPQALALHRLAGVPVGGAERGHRPAPGVSPGQPLVSGEVVGCVAGNGALCHALH